MPDIGYFEKEVQFSVYPLPHGVNVEAMRKLETTNYITVPIFQPRTFTFLSDFGRYSFGDGK